MKNTSEAAIDIVEAGYALNLSPEDWLPNVLAAGAELLDLGMGVGAGLHGGALPDGQPRVVQVAPGTIDARVYPGIVRTAQEVGPDLVQQTTEALVGGINVLSEDKDRWPKVYEAITRNVGCKDLLTFWCTDPDFHGPNIVVASPETIRLNRQRRELFRMLTVHVAAGYRLRRRVIGQLDQRGVATAELPAELPLEGEALLDPKVFSVAHASGDARAADARDTLRDAAVRVDRARGKLRRSDPNAALELWTGLVHGRWSLVDWFDTDGRRFVVAKPNTPNVGDPRGLTEKEAMVAAYAARGESGKILSYRFGFSKQRVSMLLKSAMTKLRVQTQAELVAKIGPFAFDNKNRTDDEPSEAKSPDGAS